MLVDHVAMTIIIVSTAMISMLLSSIILIKADTTLLPFGGKIMICLVAALMSIYFNKDIFSGRSVAKRILKLQVISVKTDKPASPVQCILRNLTIIIWPVEVIVTMVNPTRRLGDLIANTRVDYYTPQQETEKRNWKSFFAAIAIGFMIMISFGLLITAIPDRPGFTSKDPDRISIERITKTPNISIVYSSKEEKGIRSGYAEVTVYHPVIPNEKIRTLQAGADSIAGVMKTRLRKMNEPVYSRIVIVFNIPQEEMRYEYGMDYQTDKSPAIPK